MTIVVTPVHAQIRGRIPLQLFEALKGLLRYRPNSYQYDWRFKARQWDGWHPLHALQPDGILFPAGLLARVIAEARVHGVEPAIAWSEPLQAALATSGPSSPLPNGTKLFDDQEYAVELAVKYQRGIWALATNFGKTVTAAGLLQAYKDRHALFLVDAKGLLVQTANEIGELLQERVGVYGDNQRPRGNPRVTIATIQTMKKRLEKPETRNLLAEADVLIADEADVISPASWFPVLASCPAPVRIAMSGTVREAHSLMVVEAYFGPIIHEVAQRDLVHQGRSAEPVIFMPYAGATGRESDEYGDTYMKWVVHNGMRNRILVEAAEMFAQAGLRSLILFYRIEHGQILHRDLQARGIRSVVLDGNTPTPEIERAKRALTESRLDVILASTIFNRGQDVPAFECYLNAASWKSPRATKQKLGRGVRRKTSGPNRVIVVDPHDLGDEDLKRHAVKRGRLYIREGFPVNRGTWGEIRSALQEVLADTDTSMIKHEIA